MKLYSTKREDAAFIKAMVNNYDNMTESLEYWYPHIEGHFEGKSDEFDAALDKLRATLTAATHKEADHA